MSPPSSAPVAAAGATGGPAPITTRARGAAGDHPVLVVWFATIVFSTGPVMIASTSVSGPVFSFWRLWIGVPLVGGLAYAAHRRTPTVWTRSGLRWTLAAGVAFAIHQITLMIALKNTSVVDVTLMNTLAPLVVAVLAVPLFDERPGRRFRLWSLVAIGGAVMVAVAGSAGPSGHPVGMAFAAVNVVFYSFFFVSSKQAREHVPTMSFLAVATLVAAVAVSIYVVSMALAGLGEPITSIDRHDLLMCIGVAALPGLVGHFSMTWSVKWVPANVPPLILLTQPFFAGMLAWLLLGQTTTWAKVAGGAVTLGGVLGALRASGPSTLPIEALDLAEET